MEHKDFRVGMEFTTADGGRRWRVTDVGVRTVVAIRVDQVEIATSEGKGAPLRHETLSGAQAEEQGWFNGPPYAVAEHVFDEDGLEDCEPVPAAQGLGAP